MGLAVVQHRLWSEGRGSQASLPETGHNQRAFLPDVRAGFCSLMCQTLPHPSPDPTSPLRNPHLGLTALHIYGRKTEHHAFS